MSRPAKATPDQAVEIVDRIQESLFGETDDDGNIIDWQIGKHVDSTGYVSDLVDLLREHDLCPGQSPKYHAHMVGSKWHIFRKSRLIMSLPSWKDGHGWSFSRINELVRDLNDSSDTVS